MVYVCVCVCVCVCMCLCVCLCVCILIVHLYSRIISSTNINLIISPSFWMCNTRISEVMKNMEKIVWNKVLCQEVMKYGENMEKRNSDISWRNFRELYAIFKVEIKFWYCMFHKKIANAMPWNIKKTHFHPVWNSCLDKCHRDSWHLLKRVPGTYL